jgi:hypothetical protein
MLKVVCLISVVEIQDKEYIGNLRYHSDNGSTRNLDK